MNLKELKFRKLKEDEIELRASKVKENGFGLLLYKTARTDQDLLDETVGALNWQRDHKELKENMYCGIGIWDDETKQWIWKWDAGKESNNEAEKGEASDSFKRAGFNWGIGRELYTSPFIWCVDKSLIDKSDGKYRLSQNAKLHVSEIKYDNDVISKLKIRSGKKTIFMFGYTTEEENKEITLQPAKKSQIQAIDTLMVDSKYKLEDIYKKYNVENLYELTQEQADKIIKGLEKEGN